MFIVAFIDLCGFMLGHCFVEHNLVAFLVLRSFENIELVALLQLPFNVIDCECAASLPRGTVSWFTVCDCDFSWSCILANFFI